MCPSLRSLVLFVCLRGVAASCPEEVCVSGVKASRGGESEVIEGTYKRQSEGGYNRVGFNSNVRVLIKEEGTWKLGNRNWRQDLEPDYFEAVSPSACPTGVSYRDHKTGNKVDVKVGTCSSDGTGSTEEGGAGVGGVIASVVVTLLIVVGIAVCFWKCCCPCQGAASAPAAEQVSCPHCKAVRQVIVHGDQLCEICGKTFTVGPTLLGAPCEEAKQHINTTAQDGEIVDVEAGEGCPEVKGAGQKSSKKKRSSKGKDRPTEEVAEPKAANPAPEVYVAVTLFQPSWCQDCGKFLKGFSHQGQKCCSSGKIVCLECSRSPGSHCHKNGSNCHKNGAAAASAEAVAPDQV